MDHGIVPEPPIVFIGGSGRSGTNISKEILALHPDVATLPFEYRFIIDPNGIIDFYTRAQQHWSPYAIDNQIKQLEQFLRTLAKKPEPDSSGSAGYFDWELDQWIPGYSEFVTQLIDDLTEFSYTATWPGIPPTHNPGRMYFASPDREHLRRVLGRFVHQCVHAILEQEKTGVFIEDNTWNILYAKELLELCPSGRLIHMVRNPRDVIASLRTQRWTPDTVRELVVWYSEVMGRWNMVRNSLQESHYLEVRLEDLVGNTETIVKKICDFIPLPFHEKLLNLPLDRAHSGRWKSELQPEEQNLVEEELSDIIDEYQY